MEAKRLKESAEPQLDEVKCSEGADLMPSNTDKDHCHLCEVTGSSLASTFWYGKGETVRSPWCSIYAGLLCTGTGAISPDAGRQNQSLALGSHCLTTLLSALTRQGFRRLLPLTEPWRGPCHGCLVEPTMWGWGV